MDGVGRRTVIDYEFADRLAFSKSVTSTVPETLIADMLPGCTTVSASDQRLDRRGVDFVATLRRGAEVYIDLKAREAGCSQYWRNGPELALETWSVVPENCCAGRAGWTLDEAKLTDYTLHVFDPSDSTVAYMLPFQLLRAAFRANVTAWMATYRHARQNSGGWRSECVFVPASVVMSAIDNAMVRRSADG